MEERVYIAELYGWLWCLHQSLCVRPWLWPYLLCVHVRFLATSVYGNLKLIISDSRGARVADLKGCAKMSDEAFFVH